MMKLDYYTLLSPTPVTLSNIGHVKSPTLLEISQVTYSVYNTYINLLLMTIDKYYTMIYKNKDYFNMHSDEEKEIILKVKAQYDSYTDEQKSKLSFYNIFIYDSVFCNMMQKLFDFFFVESIIYDINTSSFVIQQNYNITNTAPQSNIVGIINEKNYDVIVDVILQLNKIERNIIEDKTVKVKNKIAQQLLNKMKNAIQVTQKKEDKKLELANLISALASHSMSLNMSNIWNLTIYQLYDQFERQQIEDSYRSSLRSVSMWGDKDNKFDNTLWFTHIKK